MVTYNTNDLDFSSSLLEVIIESFSNVSLPYAKSLFRSGGGGFHGLYLGERLCPMSNSLTKCLVTSLSNSLSWWEGRGISWTELERNLCVFLVQSMKRECSTFALTLFFLCCPHYLFHPLFSGVICLPFIISLTVLVLFSSEG